MITLSPSQGDFCATASPLFALHSYAIRSKNVQIEETVTSQVGAYGGEPPCPKGGPVVGVQKTTIRVLGGKSVEGNEGLRPHMRRTKIPF
jgi:hypothetical protein